MTKMLKNGHKIKTWKDEIDKILKIEKKEDQKITGVILNNETNELKVYYGFKGEHITYSSVSNSSLKKFKTQLRGALRKIGATNI